jgi:leucyl aminopeptidase
MKEIINVEIKARKADVSSCETDLLIIGRFSGEKKPDKITAALDEKLGGAIERIIKLDDFKGKEGTSAIIYGNETIDAKRILLIGLGEEKKATLNTLRKAAAYAANKAVAIKAKNVGMALHAAFGRRFDTADMARVMAEGIYFGSYRYDEFVTESENGRLVSLEVELIDSEQAKIKALENGLISGVIVGRIQSYARTLANRPANVISPAKLAEEAQKVAKSTTGVSCTVLDEKEIAAKGMGGLSAVGAGSQNKPRFIVLKYKPANRSANSLPTVALVGKAITFDSGGIDIKPSANMEQMKLDKSGGIAVLSAVKAAAELKLPVNLYGIVPAAENLPSGSSYRPGDIVTTFSGKTVEIQNTDAEGRMILCDALEYAVKENCDIIIDIATLTGACMVALGQYMAGLMGNDERLIKQIQAAAEESGEKVWPMPSGDEYAKEMKSKIADLKNVGSRWGGACTGAAFLKQFVDDKKWAHLDIAGVDMIEKSTEYSAEGASGFGVRLLTTYLMNIVKKNKK